MSTMREQFEAWAEKENYALDLDGDAYWNECTASAYQVWQAATEAAKATGTAGELDRYTLRRPSQTEAWMEKSKTGEFVLLADLGCGACGNACNGGKCRLAAESPSTEAARQPAPALSQGDIHLITCQEVRKIGSPLVDKVPADCLTALGRAIAERVLAATNRSQP